jgi:dnd system-associated protein 4
MRDRIRPTQEHEASVLDMLKDSGVFATKQKGLMFAAALGYRRSGRALPPDDDERRYGEGIRIEYFERALDDGFIDALAVASSGTLEILADNRQEERVALFERYAAIGLEEMERTLVQVPMPPLDATLALLDELSTPENSSLDSLPGLAQLL